MNKYRVESKAIIRVVTLVDANSEEEAEKEAQDRDVSICIHGSVFLNHGVVISEGGYDFKFGNRWYRAIGGRIRPREYSVKIRNEDEFILIDGTVESVTVDQVEDKYVKL